MESKFYVYTHSIDGMVFYVGAAQGRPQRAYEKTMRPKKWYEFVDGNNGEYEIEIVAHYDNKKEARKAEAELIYFYHDHGLAEANGEDLRGERSHMFGNGHKVTGERNGWSKSIIVFKDGEPLKEYVSIFEWAKEMGAKSTDDSISKGCQAIANGIIRKRGRFVGYTAIKKSEYSERGEIK